MSGATTTKPSAVSTSNSQLKVKCYLSFDDGPNANTGTILDVLAAEHVKATFYLTGKNLKSVPDLQYKLVRRMINEGHDLGNHGYDHDPMMRRDYLKSTPSAVKKDFEDNLSYFNTLFSKRNSKFPGFSSARLPGDGRFLKNYVDMIKGQEKLSHVSWDIEFSYNGRFTHLDKLDWQAKPAGVRASSWGSLFSPSLL